MSAISGTLRALSALSIACCCTGCLAIGILLDPDYNEPTGRFALDATRRALREFVIEHDRWPRSRFELWRGRDSSGRIDPWGNDVIVGLHEEHVILLCLGPDGTKGTEDDLVSLYSVGYSRVSCGLFFEADRAVDLANLSPRYRHPYEQLLLAWHEAGARPVFH